MPEMNNTECGEQIEGSAAAYPCYLTKGHDGPHAARELQVTERRRQAWLLKEKDAQAARAVLAQSQGPAQSFNELRGEIDESGHSAGTPVPGSSLQPRDYRVQHQPKPGETGEEKVDPKVQKDWLRQTLLSSGMDRSQVDDAITAIERSSSPSEIGLPTRPTLDEVLAQPADDPEPTKQRDGDQPLPVKNNPRGAVQDLIIEMAEESKRVGTERYGQPLKPLNGRDTFLDLMDEARDFFVYSASLKLERDEMVAHAEDLWGKLVIISTSHPEVIPMDVVDLLRPIVLWLRGTPET